MPTQGDGQDRIGAISLPQQKNKFIFKLTRVHNLYRQYHQKKKK